jgi:YD repeat-containing protein
MTDPDGHQTTTTYDSSGQVASTTDSAGNTTTYGHTGGLLTSSTDPMGNTNSYAYDSAGRMVRSTDPLGNSTSNVFDNQNNLTQTVNALGAATSFTYDAERNRTSATDANGGTTHFAYDSMNRLTSATDPLGASEYYSYDSNGQLAQFTDRRGKVAVFQYDAQNRKTLAGFGYDGSGYESTINYQYDSSDRLTQVVDSIAGTTTRTYDNFDNLIDEQTPQGEVTYSYDAAHRLQTRAVLSETPVSYTWDNAGAPLSATQGGPTLTYVYDSVGRLSSMRLPNGVVVVYSYDSDSRIAQIAYSNGNGPLGNLTYSYDANGRVVSKGGSLASIVMPTSVSGNAFNAANEMTSFNSQPLTNDPNGNLLNDGTNTYTWDSRNDLASLAGPTSASFAYDALGRRVSQTITSAMTEYLYDLANAAMPLQDFSSTDAPLLSGLGTSRADLSGTMTFLPDALGNVIALTDSTGAIQTQYSYGPFGAVAVTGTASNNPYQFAGMQNDGTGLYYGPDGFYSPSLGLNVGVGTVNSAPRGGGFANLSTPTSANATSPGTGSCDTCRAELREYQLQGYGLPVVHSFWTTWNTNSPNKITSIEGEPSEPAPEYLYARILGVSGTIGDLVQGFGPSCDVCSKVDRMKQEAEQITPALQIPYRVFPGPNCNSLAGFLNWGAGFDASPTFLMWFEGWNYPLF